MLQAREKKAAWLAGFLRTEIGGMGCWEGVTEIGNISATTNQHKSSYIVPTN